MAHTALDLFVLNGGTGTTIERICEHAGISQRTFYRHFAVKEDVVVPLFEDAAEKIVEGLETAPADLDVVSSLVGVFSVRGFGTDPPVIFQRRILSVMMDSPEYLLRWYAIDQILTGPLSEFLVRRRAAGEGPFEGELRAGLVLQASRLASHHWLRLDASDEPRDLKTLDDLLATAMSAAVPPPAADPADQHR